MRDAKKNEKKKNYTKAQPLLYRAHAFGHEEKDATMLLM